MPIERNRIVGGRFEVRRLLGQGAHAHVYEAYDLVRRGNVALKVFNEGALDAVNAEAAAQFRVEDCPAVVPIRDVLPDLVEGPATTMPIMASTLADEDAVFGSQAVRWAQALLTALDFCHNRAVVHGDVKPSNLFRAPQGSLKLGDFGVADFIGGNERGHTLEYASPELVGGAARTTLADLWAAAVVLYELLCGRLPFGTEDEYGESAVVEAIAAGRYVQPTDLRPYLPRRFREFFTCAFALNPADRFANAQAMKLALAEIPIRCEWIRMADPARVELWEGYEVDSGGSRTGVVYKASLVFRPRLAVTEASIRRSQGGGRFVRPQSAAPYRESEARARQRLYAWLRALTAGQRL